MDPNGHEHYEDELAAYMLGALEPREADDFQAHLVGCGRCQARERWLRTSLDVLPSSVEQLEPPPPLRARLMETVRSEAGVAEKRARPVSARRGLSGWLGSLSLRPATAIAGIVLVLAAGIAGYALRGGGGGQTQTVAVRPTAVAPRASGSLVRNGDRGILRVLNVPQQRGRVYEVWLVQRGRPVPSALFQVDRKGAGAAAIPSGLDRSTQVMVSSEPSGGSEQPTTKPLLSTSV
jgi:anti-sigma-K factor RskA